MEDAEIFEASEAIARGEPCPKCGAEWEPMPEHDIDTGETVGRQMIHAEDCEYMAEVDAA